MTSASSRWTAALREWALPDHVLAAAPEDPYAFPEDVIVHATIDPRRTPTGVAVEEVLTVGGRLLDVGVGAGRIAAAFTDRYDVVGVEPRDTLAEIAASRGITVVAGRWPQAAARAGSAPVVLSTHVAYDVADIAAFLRALHAAATRRVVLEVTAAHPWAPLGPLYRRFQGLDRPVGPTAADLAAVVVEVTGVTPEQQAWQRPGPQYRSLDALVAHRRRQLCLAPDADRDHALAQMLLADADVEPDGRVRLPDAELVTIWWDVG